MNRLRANGFAIDAEQQRQVYVSPRELAVRWQCSRSQVDRIARREKLTRLMLGRGRNGMVRYVFSEVLLLEEKAKA
jgi:hypothetical protein